MASPNAYFNLQSYLDTNDGDANTFVQYLVGKFSTAGRSVLPTWYKAIRGTNGDWIATTYVSDMDLNPGDYLTYIHQKQASYLGDNSTSFSTPAISFAFNVKLDGWSYNTNSFSELFVGKSFGAKPFWGKSYVSPETDIDTHFFKQQSTFGGQVRFIDEYLPIHQPEVSNMVLDNGNILTYKIRGTTSITWEQPSDFAVTYDSYQWNKIIFYKDYSNLKDIFRNDNTLDLIGYSSNEPSDIILEGYSLFEHARYNYYARNPFNYTENLFYKNKCLNNFAVFNTDIVLEAEKPYENLDNIHYPTVATVSLPSLATTEKETGGYLLPEKLGVSYYRGRGYTMNLDGDSLTFSDSMSAERLYLDTNKYGPRHRGLTKKDQWSPVKISDIDNRWMMLPYSYSSASGNITETLNNQKFTPYQSNYENTGKNDLGIHRQDDDISFWDSNGNWNGSYKYPVTFRGELLTTSYQNRKSSFLINKGVLSEWKTDIFGNNYGLFKGKNSTTSFPTITSVVLDSVYKSITLNPVSCGSVVYTGSKTILNYPPTNGLRLWIDANAMKSNYANGATVTSINDYSGYGNTLTNLAGTSPTLQYSYANGLPALVFPANGSVKNTTFFNNNSGTNSLMSVFVVAKKADANAFRYLQDYPADSNSKYGIIFYTQNYFNGLNTILLPQKNTFTPYVFGVADYTQTCLYEFVFDSSYVYVLQDGKVVQASSNYTYPLSCQPGLAIGDNSGGVCGICEYLIYNRAVTFDERHQIEAYLLNKWNIYNHKNITLLGDSRTYGAGTNTTSLGTKVLSGLAGGTLNGDNSIWHGTNLGLNGRRSLGPADPNWVVPSPSTLMIDEMTQTSYRESMTNILTVWLGVNDIILDNRTGSSIYNYLVTICTHARNNGYKVIICTDIPTSWNTTTGSGTQINWETQRTTLNSLIRSNWNTFADSIADFGADPIMGVSGAQDNTTYYSTDKLHQTDAGTLILANILQKAILALDSQPVDVNSLKGVLITNTTSLLGQTFTSPNTTNITYTGGTTDLWNSSTTYPPLRRI